MKKILNFGLVLLTLSVFTTTVNAQRGYRYTIVPGTDNKYTVPYKEIKEISYASTKTLAPTQEETTYNFAQLTGAMTVSVTITPCYTGDRMTCIFNADGTNRVVTFSTGFTVNGTLTVLANTYANVTFVFNGSKWQEVTRQNLSASSVGSLAVDSITENTAGAGIIIKKAAIFNRTATAINTTATVTAAQLAGGLLTSTSAAAVSMTLPTATLIGSYLHATKGTTFDFVVDDTAGANTVTVVVGTGITAASALTGGTTLTVSASSTVGIANFRLTFIDATHAILSRIL